MAKRRLRRSRAIIGVVVVLVLAGVATTLLVLDYHQARSNAKDNKLVQARQKAAVGFEVEGTVSAVTKTALTVRQPDGTVRHMLLTAKTRTEHASSGSVADVQPGLRSRVLFKAGVTPPALREILVLPTTSRIGQVILGSGFGLVWWRTASGHTSAKAGVVDAVVDTAHDAARTDVVVGAKVFVHAQNTVTKPIRTSASEIVVLPAGTALVG